MARGRFISLDRRGLDYVREHLSGVNVLSTVLLDVVTLAPGSVFTFAPAETDLERLYRFGEGRLAPPDGDYSHAKRAADGASTPPVASFKVEQAALLTSVLREKPDFVCILDDFNPRWSEIAPAPAATAFGVDEEVYHLVGSADAPSVLIALLHQTDTVWHSVAVVCATAPLIDEDGECTLESLQAAAASAVMITCTAYDGEGFIVWRRY